jgi:hypothetical protein
LAPVATQQWDAVIDDPADRYGATADTDAAQACPTRTNWTSADRSTNTP